MKNTRRNLRIKCDSRCVLILDKSTYEGILEDVSMCGALVRISGNPMGVRPGSSGELYLCHDPDVCPGKCTCHVARVTQKDIGLAFVNTH